MINLQSRSVLIATQNRGKIREFRRLMMDIGAEFVGLDTMMPVAPPDEIGATFLENAVLKARYYSERFGKIALADDSGLVVDALDGEPGVHSARYGGDGLDDADRTQLLLKNLRDVPIEDRTARFECVLALTHPGFGGDCLHSVGIVEGRITFEPRGNNGFGYDPVFVPEGETMTTAEMSPERKDALSHRGRAIRAIAPKLRSLIATV